MSASLAGSGMSIGYRLEAAFYRLNISFVSPNRKQSVKLD